MVESTAKLREEIMALSGVDIMEVDGQTFKSTYAIMEELANKWQDLTDIQQASITELIAGKRQGNIVSALMTNFDIADNALKTSLDSSGSAMKEHEKWMQSLEAKLQQLQAAWQDLSQTFLSSDFLKFLLDGVINLVQGLEKLIDTMGVIPTLFIAFGGYQLGKNGLMSMLFGKEFSLGSIGKLTSAFKGLFSVFARGGQVSAGSASLLYSFGGMSNVLKNLPTLFKNSATGASTLSGSLLNTASASGGATGAFAKLLKAIPKHPYILAAATAVGVLGYAYFKAKKDAEELSEEVDKLTSEYQIQHKELIDNKSSFESMASKYAELSKGVDGLGRNVSLTADEYSEYQSVVNDIAAQVPSLVSGYDSQGNAILSCKGNVEELTAAYEKLIHIQNNEILSNSGDIEKDFKNKLEDLDTYNLGDKGMTTSVAKGLEEIYNNKGKYTTRDDVFDYIQKNFKDKIGTFRKGVEYELEQAGIDTSDGVEAAIAETLKTNPEKIKSILDSFGAELDAAAEDAKTIAQATLSEAFDISDSKYYDMSDTMKNLANQVVSSFDSEFFADLVTQGTNIEDYINGILDDLNNLSSNENTKIEAALNLKTQFNDGDVSFGQYIDGLKKAETFINSLNLDDEVKEQILLSLNTEQVTQDYDALKERLTSKDYNIQMGTEEAEKFLNDLTAGEYAVFVDMVASGEFDFSNFDAKSFGEYLEEQAKLNEALAFKPDIEVDTTALEALNTALEESASAMGLSEESLESLKSKYSDLDGYNYATLFERTANGVKVNREELAKLEKEQNDLKKSEIKEHIESLRDAYNDNAKKIDECTNATERAKLMADNEIYRSQIEELAEYEAQLDGVTGAYQRWIDAQNATEDYEGYESIATSREDIEDEISRGFISNKSKAYIDLLSGEDLVGGTIDEYHNAFKKLDDVVTSTGYSINDFFTLNDDGDITSTGIDRFFESVEKDIEGIYNADTGLYDFSQENLKKIQDEYGMGIEAIELMLEAAASAGYDIDWGSIIGDIDLETSDFETFVHYAELMQGSYNKIKNLDDVHFNFTATGVEEAETEIEKARSAFSQFINEDGTVNLKADGAEEMQFILSTLIIQKQQLSTPAVMKVDTSQIEESKEEIRTAIEAAQGLQTAYENYEIAISTGVDVEEAKTQLSTAIDTMKGTSVDVRADLKLPSDAELEAASTGLKAVKVGAKLDDTAVGALETKIQTECTPEVIAKVTGLDETAIENGEGNRQVKYTAEHSEVDAYINSLTDINKKIIFKYTTDGTKPNPSDIERKITYTYETKGDKPSPAAGTAHANGTTGRSFARGNWGIKGNGTALGGELAPELLVRDGRWHLIGENGAEFFNYRQNDIIFNAAQTESLFKYGGIRGAKPRGTMLAGGTAFSNGSIGLSGRAFAWKATGTESSFAKDRKDGSSTTFNYNNCNIYNNDTTTKTTKKSNSSSSSSSSKSKDTKDDFEESFDWIEVLITRVEEAMDRLDQKVNRTYKTWSSRNKNLDSELSLIEDAIEVQNAAYNGYMAEANSVGLEKKWRQKVQNGTVDISTIKDEDLANKISEYQDWYNKAVACKDAIQDLKDKEAELYMQRFDNITTKYDDKIGVIDTRKSVIEQNIEQANYKTNVKNLDGSNYKKLVTQEKNTITQLQAKKKELQAQLNKAVNDGVIKKYSEDWYAMRAEIDATTLAIEESTTNISQYYSDMFDRVSDKYEGVLQGFEHTETMLNEYISQAEAKGHIVSKEYYQALAENEKSNIATLKKEQADLIKARDEAVASGAIKKGSLEWHNMCAEIDATTQAIEEGETALLEYANSMRDIDWQVFDLMQERISNVTKEADFLIELMSNDKLFDDNGKMTAEGIATMSLHGQNYNTHMYQADEYGKEIAELDKEIAKDPYDQDLINRRQELLELQRESILAAEDEKQAMIDLVKEGIEIELDALQERIDKHNEELDSMKDLYDYQKKVKEQTEEIADLEKQISAYSGSDDEESNAKVQQLMVELEDAKEDLEETEYEKYISDQKALLDSLYLEYETVLNQRLDNVDALLSKMITAINAAATGNAEIIATALGEGGSISTILGGYFNEDGTINKTLTDSLGEGGTIKSALEKQAGAVGATLSNEMKNIWTTEGTGTNSILTTYGDGFQNKQTTTNTTLNGIKIGVNNMVAALSKEAEEKIEEPKTQPSSKADPTGKNSNGNNNKSSGNSNKDDSKKDSKKSAKNKNKNSGDGKAKIGDKVKFVSGKYYYDSYGTKPLGSHNKGKYVYITNINKKGSHPYHISTGKKLGKGDLGWLKLKQLSGYFTGKKKIEDNEMAWTQEKGTEFIVRKSDGAILTPVAKNDSILNAAASNNIWDMANNPTEFIKENLGLNMSGVPNNSSVQNSCVQNFDNIVFNMPNVRNYNEMLAQMQNDKTFEKLVQAMTVDRVAGKSSLAKNKVKIK